MRDHLRKNWEVARQWPKGPEASDGSPCLIEHMNKEGFFDKKEGSMPPFFYNKWGTRKIFGELGLSATEVVYKIDHKGGRERSLQLIERAIAKQEEHVVQQVVKAETKVEELEEAQVV